MAGNKSELKSYIAITTGMFVINCGGIITINNSINKNILTDKTEDERHACHKMSCRFAIICGRSTRLTLLLFKEMEFQACLVIVRIHKMSANCRVHKFCSFKLCKRCLEAVKLTYLPVAHANATRILNSGGT